MGEVDYDITGLSNKAVVDMDVTSVLPYAHWQPRLQMDVWSMLSAGWRDMKVETARSAGRIRTTDLSSLMDAVGRRQTLTTWRRIDLAAKTDAFLTTVRSDPSGGAASRTADAAAELVQNASQIRQDLGDVGF